MIKYHSILHVKDQSFSMLFVAQRCEFTVINKILFQKRTVNN